MTKSFLSTEQFIEVFSNSNFADNKIIDLFSFIYTNGNKATATEIASHFGFKHLVIVNGIVGKLGRKICEFYGISTSKRKSGSIRYWQIFFDGEEKGSFFVWILKKELKEALDRLMNPEEFVFADELLSETELFEGLKKTITVNAYERNSIARKICVSHYGYFCSVCGFDFEKKFGGIGKNFIHVHHLVKISDIGKNYIVDPIKDLRPVCPNCHSMIHKKNPPFAIDELRNIIKEKH